MPEMSRISKVFCTSAPYRAVARRMLRRSLQGVRPAGEVLEIGAGSGAMAAQLLASFPEVRLVATDYDADMLDVARQTVSTFGDRAAVERADATQLPFEDGRFDLVLCFTMLHHVGDWETALSEAVRGLGRGGGSGGWPAAGGGGGGGAATGGAAGVCFLRRAGQSGNEGGSGGRTPPDWATPPKAVGGESDSPRHSPGSDPMVAQLRQGT